jgi:hypothetical protein
MATAEISASKPIRARRRGAYNTAELRLESISDLGPTRPGRTARALRKDDRDGLGLIWREAPRADVFVEQVG